MTNKTKLGLLSGGWCHVVSPKMRKAPADRAVKHFNEEPRTDGAAFRSRQVSKSRYVVEVFATENNGVFNGVHYLTNEIEPLARRLNGVRP